MSDFIRCGVFATADEIETIKAAYRTPYMVIGSFVPAPPEETVHRIALAHGLPEIKGYYGCDLRDGEFLKLAGAEDEPPDSWPSRRKEDVLRGTGS